MLPNFSRKDDNVKPLIEEEQITIYDHLVNTIGKHYTIPQYNSILQAIFNKYTTTFIDEDIFDNLENNFVIFDEDDMYTIGFNIINSGEQDKLEITDVLID